MKAPHTRSVRFPFQLLIAIACLGGCTTYTSTRTTVVLLPDEDGKVGAVSMLTPSGTQTLDKAYSYTTGNGINAAPSSGRTLSRATVSTAYGDLLKMQPAKPRTFILTFLLDRTELTDESKASLPALFSAVRERKPTRISIFGHADALGSQERNVRLSADRATAAANLLKAHDPTLDGIDVQYFGDTMPLTPSATRAADPKNRRVEIMVF
jgi:outer membrane protein OmpA-like peptidoglycan-associated protein